MRAFFSRDVHRIDAPISGHLVAVHDRQQGSKRMSTIRTVYYAVSVVLKQADMPELIIHDARSDPQQSEAYHQPSFFHDSTSCTPSEEGNISIIC